MLPRSPEFISTAACYIPTPFVYLDDVVFVRDSGGFPGATAVVDVDSFDLRLLTTGTSSDYDDPYADMPNLVVLDDDGSDYDDPYADMSDLVALDDDDRLGMHNPDGSSRRCFVYPLPPTPLNE